MNAGPVILGRISGVFGVRGWVKVYSYTQPKENIFSYRPWLIDGRAVTLEEAQPQGKGLVAKLLGCDDRDAAAALVGRDIAVADLPDAGKDEYYWTDLIGLQVLNRQDQVLGTVTKLLETGAHDVLVVSGERERLIPYVDAYVLSIDVGAGVMRVDWDMDF